MLGFGRPLALVLLLHLMLVNYGLMLLNQCVSFVELLLKLQLKFEFSFVFVRFYFAPWVELVPLHVQALTPVVVNQSLGCGHGRYADVVVVAVSVDNF